MAITNSTTLANVLPEIVAEAVFQANERSLMRALVRNFNIPAGSGNSIKVPVYPVQAAGALTEGVAPTALAVDTGSKAITVGEVGMTATISDIAMIGSSSNVIADIGGQFGRGIAQKIDEDLCALFDGFSTSIGGATTALTPALIFEAIATLRAANVPASDMAVVIHPEIAYDLKSGLTNTFAQPNSGMNSEVMRDTYVGNMGGVNIYESSAMGISTRVSKGAIFHKDALGLAMMQDIKIETQRESTLRADTLTATAVYGVGELQDAYGVELHNQTSLT
jgi:N4-gp56 family major capsid protein